MLDGTSSGAVITTARQLGKTAIGGRTFARWRQEIYDCCPRMQEMTQDPYQPPASAVADRAPARISLKAAFIGACCAQGAPFFLNTWSAPLLPLLGSIFSRGDAAPQLQQAPPHALEYVIPGLIAGAIGNWLCGYVAASVAGRQPMKHAIAGAMIYLVTYLGPFLNSPRALSPQWYELVAYAIIIPCAMAGAFAYQRRTRTAVPS